MTVNAASSMAAPGGLMGELWQRAQVRPRLAILLVCLIALIPGFFTTPPVDRDESRYMQASRQMIESGDFIEIRFQDTARNKKPAGIYWMQAATASLFGGADAPAWAYRIPSLLGALGAALATFWAGAALFDRRVALLGAMMAGVSLSAVFEGHIAKTDAMLLFTVVLAQGAMAHAYLSARRGEAKPGWSITTLFWVAQGVGILIKGPITPMVSALTFAALAIWDRDMKWGARLRPLTGIIIAAVVAVPWFLAIWKATDGAFFAEAVGTDMGGKIFSGQERHGGPPGYHLAFLSLMFWPASLFLIPAAIRTWETRAQDAVRFCITWIIPVWIIFEFTSTKLPHYVLPTYPALALLCAAFILHTEDWRPKLWGRIGIGLWVLVTLLLAVIAVGLPAVYGEGILWGALPLALLILAGVFVTARAAWSGATLDATLKGLLTGILAMATAFQITIPNLTDFALSPRLAAAVAEYEGPGDPAPVSVGFTEPSLVFLLGTDTVLTNPEEAADHLAETPGAVALITTRFDERFRTRADELGLTLDQRATVEGYNYSGGDPLTINVYRAEGGLPAESNE